MCVCVCVWGGGGGGIEFEGIVYKGCAHHMHKVLSQDQEEVSMNEEGKRCGFSTSVFCF